MHWWLRQGRRRLPHGRDQHDLQGAGPAGCAGASPATATSTAARYFINGPRLLEFLREMKREVLSKYDILTVGETPLVTTAACDRDHQRGDRRAEHGVPVRAHGPGCGPRRGIVAAERQALEPAGPEAGDDPLAEGPGRQGLEQHLPDQPRPAARRSRALATTAGTGSSRPSCWPPSLHMLQGTPYVYQGEEIGMTNVALRVDRRTTATSRRSTCTASWWRSRASTRRSSWRSSTPRAATTPARRCSGMTSAERRLHQRHALDQGQPQLHGDQRRAGAGRSGLHLPLLPAADPAAPGRTRSSSTARMI